VRILWPLQPGQFRPGDSALSEADRVLVQRLHNISHRPPGWTLPMHPPADRSRLIQLRDLP